MKKTTEAKQSTYDKIRDIIISRLEEAKKAAEDGSAEDAFHWIKGWSGSGLPYNVSHESMEHGKPLVYQGINQMLLSLACGGADEWLTFSAIKRYQEKDKSVKLRKGAKGQSIVYFDKYVKKDKDGNPVEVDDDGNAIPHYFAKMYYVFSVEDVENLPRRFNKVKHYEHDANISIEHMESVLSYYYKASGIEVETIDGGNQAYFMPAKNLIRIPQKDNHITAESYAHTLLHESGHSTGKALGRDIHNSFGSKEYSYEELVADITADFLMCRFHITTDSVSDDQLKNSIAYLSNWIAVLKEQPAKMIVKASTDAQNAADYIIDTAYEKMKEEMIASKEAVLQFDNGNFLYIQDIGGGEFEYSFYDSNGSLIDSGIHESKKAENIYDVANDILEDVELSVDEGWLVSVGSFKEYIWSMEEGRGEEI